MYFKKISLLEDISDPSQKGDNAVDIPDYGKDHFTDGEENETNKANIPSIIAAKTAGGDPLPTTLANDVNEVPPQEGGISAKL